MSQSRYVVGIDLGTSNCAVSFVDTAEGPDDSQPIRLLQVPQLVNAGEIGENSLLPSFIYLAGSNELPSGSLKLPWNSDQDYALGELARKLGEKIPRRLVASAKSWLCHSGVDRKASILPWGSEEDITQISPLEASARFLAHVRDAWNSRMASEDDSNRLEKQDVLLTVPASFDEVARTLTSQAAKGAGLKNVTLLEEPQAAFYSWLAQMDEEWREHVSVGDVFLVCDIGGGTTDFTLISVSEEDGNLALERLAVGEHILLGGDNMDLALAHFARAKLEAEGHRLSTAQTLALWQACRAAKEELLSNSRKSTVPVTVVGQGSRLVGGTLKTSLSRDEIMEVILDGFFPRTEASEYPATQRRTGLQELGLNYASDAAVPRHLARFLNRHLESWPERPDEAGFVHPTALLFNGGVTKAPRIQERFTEIVNGWLKKEKAEPVRLLESNDPDLAVARGAAYYGLVRRGRGVRIRGGTARTYYIGIETSMPAVPGMPPPLKALCVAPLGMEEGSELEVPDQEFGLVVGETAEFRFLSSTSRRDESGALLEDWDPEEIEELSPVETVLTADGEEGRTVPVMLKSRVTELGTLELWCVSRDGADEWKLEFNYRETEAE